MVLKGFVIMEPTKLVQAISFLKTWKKNFIGNKRLLLIDWD
jgi:hypothetical protein